MDTREDRYSIEGAFPKKEKETGERANTWTWKNQRESIELVDTLK